MDLKFIVLFSVLAQLSAAALALRLIRVTGHRAAWALISVAVLLMAVRRGIPLYHIFYSGAPSPPHYSEYETVGLVISLLMLAGIAGIAPLFRAIRSREEALRRSEEKFRRIVDTAQEGILFMDASGTAIYANHRLAGMLGYAPEEMRGRPIADFLREGCDCIESMEKVGRPEGPVTERRDCQLRRKDGSLLWTIVSANALRDDAGTSIGGLMMVADISDRKRMEEEREVLIGDLKAALAKVKTLKGLLPACAWCGKVRDENGAWQPMEVYIMSHSDASFSHGMCPECAVKFERRPPTGETP